MSDPIVKVEDLSFGWDDGVLQEGASFEIERGSVFGLLGASGSGKSTLLRYLVGLELPLGGRITVDGQVPDQEVDSRPTFGVMFQYRLCLQAKSASHGDRDDCRPRCSLRTQSANGRANYRPPLGSL